MCVKSSDIRGPVGLACTDGTPRDEGENRGNQLGNPIQKLSCMV